MCPGACVYASLYYVYIYIFFFIPYFFSPLYFISCLTFSFKHVHDSFALFFDVNKLSNLLSPHLFQKTVNTACISTAFIRKIAAYMIQQAQVCISKSVLFCCLQFIYNCEIKVSE